MPALDVRLVALRRPLDRSLNAPPGVSEEAADVIGVIAHAECAPDHHSGAFGGPDIPTKPEAGRPTSPEGRNLRPLLRRQPGRAAESGPDAQRLHAAFPSALDPLADCSTTHA